MRFAVNRQPVAPPGAAPAWARESLLREIVVQLTFFAFYLLLDRASTVFRRWAGTPAWYSVPHDLRAPLRQIQGFSHLLGESHTPDLGPEAHRYIRNIIEGAQHMGRLIDHLLELSRLGRRALRLEVRSLAALVEDARRDLARDIDGRDVCWQIGELPLVERDAALIRRSS